MPKYFGSVYPDVVDPETNEVITPYSDYYFALNAIIVSICGLCSALGGGILSDKYEKKGILMTNANISASVNQRKYVTKDTQNLVKVMLSKPIAVLVINLSILMKKKTNFQKKSN